MGSQLISNAKALRLFFTEDVYLVENEKQTADQIGSNLTQSETVTLPIKIDKSIDVPAIVAEPLAIYKTKLTFEFLGNNQKSILILVNDATNKVSSAQGTELLRKLVKAIALTNNDFALVNYANYKGTSYTDLHEFFSCELLLSFGVDTETLGLNELPLHQLVTVAQAKMVFTKNLHDLDSDQIAKKTLWGSLQQIK